MKSKNKPRVVVDTNLLISATISSRGIPNKLVRAWQKNKFFLLISPRLIRELEEVSGRDKFGKYHVFLSEMEELVVDIKSSAELIESISEEYLSIHSRDPKDDHLIAASLVGNADYLVTGDEDLLILDGNPALGKLKIISARNFLKIL